VLLLFTFLACRLSSGSSSGTMTRRGLCWKADVTVTGKLMTRAFQKNA
jgi:hypothetical protein